VESGFSMAHHGAFQVELIRGRRWCVNLRHRPPSPADQRLRKLVGGMQVIAGPSIIARGTTGLADLVALEVQGGPATDSARTAHHHSQDGRRESVMGRGADCQ
jgi:hypothetical protein